MTTKQPAPAAFNKPAERLNIAHTPVESSQIASVGHDPSTNTLSVTFKRGATYQYPDVSANTAAAFMKAESKGKFFGQHIKALPFKKFAKED